MQTLEFVSDQLNTFRSEMAKDFEHQVSRVENCLLKMGERAEEFFDEKVGILADLNIYCCSCAFQTLWDCLKQIS